jgi:4-hydroxybenzoate polyprenyltransferase
MIGLGQILTGFYLLENQWWKNETEALHFGFLVLASLCSAAGGYVINDYYDVKIDVLNKPKRVVVGKFISRRKAMFLHVAFIVLSLSFSYFLGKRVFFTVAFCSSWLWLYSNALKRLPFIGNFSIAVLTSLSLYLPALAFPPAKTVLPLFCLFAFWISLIREIIKDMEDMRGDARHGCKTLPIVWGIRKTKVLLYATGLLFLITFLGASIWLPKLWILTSFLLAIPLSYLFFELKKADTSKAFDRLSLICKWIMLAGMATIVLIG